MTVLATYDVRDDNRRARLAGLLQAWGDRIQYSVFLLTLPNDELSVVVERARSLLDADDDSLYFFRQCSDCWETHVSVGQAYAPSREVLWAVL